MTLLDKGKKAPLVPITPIVEQTMAKVRNPYEKKVDGRIANVIAAAEEQEVERQLGEAANTAIGDKTAARAYAAYRKYMQLPPKPTPTEIEGDNAENEMANFCLFLSTRHFPLNFDEDLNPPKGSKSHR